MKVTFLRKSHANNSSSDHSVIFLNNEALRSHIYSIAGVDHDSCSDYGWNYFLLQTPTQKIDYLLLIAFYTLYYGTKLSYKKSVDCIFNRLSRFIHLSSYKNEEFHSKIKRNEQVSIDHQSIFYFPLKRKPKGVDWYFCNCFFSEILREDHVILGGSDCNDDQLIDSRKDAPVSSIETIYKFLRDFSHQPIYSEFNEKTKEFILSSDGGLLTIKI